MISTRTTPRVGARALCLALAVSLSSLASWAQVSVTATGGTTGPTTYTTLKGAFDAVNAGTHQGAITISITGNTTETLSAELNSGTVAPASYTSVLVKPATGTNPVVSGVLAGSTSLVGALVKLNGADNVTIDGSNTVGGTTRDLTFTNSGISFSTVIAIVSANAINGATNNMIKNCVVSGGGVGSLAATVGIYSGSVVATGVPSDANNANNSIQNNSVIRCFNGIYIYGYGSLPYDAGWTITGNNLGSSNNADYLNSRGLLLYNASNFNVNDNIVVGVHSLPTATTQSLGLQIGGLLLNGNVLRNKISDILHTNNSGNTANTLGAFGLTLAASSTNSNVTVANNFFADISAYGHATVLSQAGIYVATGDGFKLYHNSISLTTNPGLANAYTTAIVINTATGLDFRNNIFSNTQTTATPTNRLAIYSLGTSATFTNINGNNYYTTGTWLGYLSGYRTTLANWQTATGQDAASENILPVFNSISDLHLSGPANPTLDNQGIPLAAITNDIDGDVRSTTTPDIGADEFSICPPIAFTQPTHDTACIGGSASFTAASTAATAWQWQLNTGAGWTNIANNATYGGATTATLTITGATTAMSGYQYRVYATSACANDTSAVRTLTVSPVPAAPTITSNSPVCGGGTITLTATAVATGGTVTWSGPVSYTATGTPATRTNVTPAMGGSYSATTTVLGCASAPATTNVTVNPTPAIASAVGTNPTTCSGANGSIALSGLAANTTYTTSYSLNGVAQTPLTLTSNASGVLTIPNLGNGNYTAFAVSASGCPSGTLSGSVALNGPGTPLQPSAITGQTTGCIGGGGQTYSVTAVAGATYAWTLPPGWTGSSVTNSITATAGAGAGAGTITVTASNSCGTSPAQTLTVNVATVPVQPGPITGTLANCSGVAQLYSVQPVTGATAYAWTLPTGWSGTSTTFSISATPGSAGGTISVVAQNVCGSSAPKTLTVTSNPSVSPAVSILPSTPTTICAGTPVTFTAVPTAGGTTPTYHWLRNGVSTGTYSTTYANSTLAPGDVIQVMMTSNAACALPSPTVTGSISMTVLPNTLAGVTVSAAFPTSPVVCAGQPVTFVASTIGAGTTPTYAWRLNGAPVGTNAAIYTTPSLNTGDSVWCILTSSASCALPQPATSNKIGLQVATSVAPNVVITASPDTALAAGQPVTFTAAAVVGDGPTPGYQWLKNGLPIGGATGPSYTTTAWASGDQFSLRMVSSAPCAAPGVATSNALRMYATTSVGGVAGMLAAGLSVWPNPNDGHFTLALHNLDGNKRTRIEVLNALGQVVWMREVIVDQKDWNTDVELGAGIANGIYMLRLTGEDGSRITERFELRR